MDKVKKFTLSPLPQLRQLSQMSVNTKPSRWNFTGHLQKGQPTSPRTSALVFHGRNRILARVGSSHVDSAENKMDLAHYDTATAPSSGVTRLDWRPKRVYRLPLVKGTRMPALLVGRRSGLRGVQRVLRPHLL